MLKKLMFYISIVVFGYAIFKNQSFLVICFGVSIFIYAMGTLENAFKLMMGSKFPLLLKKCTNNRFKSLNFGLFASTIMQSSGLVSLISISFLSASLITLSTGIAIILGANLGTTTGAWIIAGFGLKVNISQYAMPLVVLGVLLTLHKDRTFQGVGYFLFSIGVLFLGIDSMKSGFEGMGEAIDLSKFAIIGFKGVVIYSIIGVIATMIMQSSHATLTLTLTALATGQIGYENAIAIAIGSNIGSTIMSVIASINSNSKGKQLMLAHVISNCTTGILAIMFIYPLMDLVKVSADLLGIKADDYTLKLALFHTYFNLILVAIYYPNIDKFAKFLSNKFSKKVNNDKASIFLHESALEYSDSAKEVLTKELKRLFKRTGKIIAKSINVDFMYIKDQSFNLDAIIKENNYPLDMDFDIEYESKFKPLYSEIVEFNLKASAKQSDENIRVFMDIRRICLLLAGVVKNARNIESNFNKTIVSDNKILKDRYDVLRVEIVQILRKSYNFISKNRLEDADELLEYIKNAIEKYDQAIFSYDYKGLNSKEITSLMNDTAICKAIVEEFAKIATLIQCYSSQETDNINENIVNL
ncbi:MAG: Na/Pi cotransporter family protein [Campylobacter sp.]|nr:Na/Pi cotransporter family protein [Campylobacter sp.]